MPETASMRIAPDAAEQRQSLDADPILAELQRIRRAIEAGQGEGICARDAAAMCGVSRASWHRLHAARLCPAPVRLAGSVRWRRSELMAWLAAGAPSRREWEAARRGQE